MNQAQSTPSDTLRSQSVNLLDFCWDLPFGHTAAEGARHSSSRSIHSARPAQGQPHDFSTSSCLDRCPPGSSLARLLDHGFSCDLVGGSRRVARDRPRRRHANKPVVSRVSFGLPNEFIHRRWRRTDAAFLLPNNESCAGVALSAGAALSEGRARPHRQRSHCHKHRTHNGARYGSHGRSPMKHR